MSAPFHFEHQLAFTPAEAAELLRQLPEAPGLLALFGRPSTTGEPAQPFLTRTANLRRRAQRLLTPPPAREQAFAPDGIPDGIPDGTPDGTPLPSRRLNLRDRVGRVAWSVTGSEFESLLALYHATSALFGLPEARRRLKLRTPFSVRFTRDKAHPRLYVTNRLSARTLDQTYGPFASRASAERFCDAVLDLFKLRRCHEDLQVHPDHPGCVYGEMKRCLAPCNLGCTAEAYAAEAAEVEAFLESSGGSVLEQIARDRDRASAQMDFEAAASLHQRFEKAKAAAALADDLVRPLSRLRAVIAQGAARDPEHAEEAALFLLQAGGLIGPERLSTLGVRAVREQTSVGSSLFAQPLMLQAIPLPPSPSEEAAAAALVPASTTPARADRSPEDRATAALAALEQKASGLVAVDVALLSDSLALLRRWYFRPEKQRMGELFVPGPDGSWPLRKILRGAARAVLGDPKTMQATDREGARTTRTRLLHAGREGVERSVPVLAPASASATSAEPGLLLSPAATPAVFRSRRSRRQPADSTPSSPAGKLEAP